MNILLGTGWSKMARKVATFVRAVRDGGNRMVATPNRPNQSPVSDWRRAVLLHWWRARKPKRRQTVRGTWNTTLGGRATRKMLRTGERTNATCCCDFSRRCGSLESIDRTRSRVRFRHLSPHPRKSVVMPKCFTMWTDDGQRDMTKNCCCLTMQ